MKNIGKKVVWPDKKIRATIKQIREEWFLRGVVWGSKKTHKSSGLPGGPHIVLSVNGTLVTISRNSQTNKLDVCQYQLTTETALGKKIVTAMKKAGLPV